MALDDEIRVLQSRLPPHARAYTYLRGSYPTRAHAAQLLEPLNVGALLVLRHHYRAHGPEPLGQLSYFTSDAQTSRAGRLTGEKTCRPLLRRVGRRWHHGKRFRHHLTTGRPMPVASASPRRHRRPELLADRGQPPQEFGVAQLLVDRAHERLHGRPLPTV